MARVVELLKRSDGVSRAALINVFNGDGLPKILKWRIGHFVPLEMTDSDDISIWHQCTDNAAADSLETNDRGVISTDSANNLNPPRPRRQAAIPGEVACRTSLDWTIVLC